MSQKISRRDVLKTAGAALGGGAALQYPAPFVLAALGSNEKLNIAVIGCGERARAALAGTLWARTWWPWPIPTKRAHRASRSASILRHKTSIPSAFRPSSTTANCSTRSKSRSTPSSSSRPTINTPTLRSGRSSRASTFTTEKCLTHDISEARILGDAARQSKVVTQMGNQGSGTGNHQLLAEYLQGRRHRQSHGSSRLVGWSTNAFGGTMDYPEGDLASCPKCIGSEWLGPAKERPYSDYFRYRSGTAGSTSPPARWAAGARTSWMPSSSR